MHRFWARWLRMLLVLVIAGVGSGYAQPARSLSDIMVVRFLNVGQGDATWLHLPNGDDILVDGGPPAAGPGIVATLQRLGVEHLDLIVATHSDADHIGGLIDVLNSLPVSASWLDNWECDTVTCSAFHQALTAQGVITSLVDAGDLYLRGSVLFAVLNPLPGMVENNHSIVLRVSHGSIDVLLTGDVENEAETALLGSGAVLEAEILKVAHHGSVSSSSAIFLASVQPDIAVISVGDNPYGQPSPEVLQRLDDVNAQVLQTNKVGLIVIESNGAGYIVRKDHLLIFLPFSRSS